MTLTTTAPPSAEPVSLAEAKAQLRVTHGEEDALIARLIAAARERVEAELGVCLLETGLREVRAVWPLGPDAALTLARGPLVGVDAVSQVGPDGSILALAFVAEPASRPGRIRLPAAPWTTPFDTAVAASLRIDYRAGFGAAPANVPEGLRQAMLALIAEAYERRGEPPPAVSAAEPWLAPWRRLRL